MLLGFQFSVANGDVTKAAAVTDAVAGELDCMRKDVGSINLYCSDCEKKSESMLGAFAPHEKCQCLLLLVCAWTDSEVSSDLLYFFCVEDQEWKW